MVYCSLTSISLPLAPLRCSQCQTLLFSRWEKSPILLQRRLYSTLRHLSWWKLFAVGNFQVILKRRLHRCFCTHIQFCCVGLRLSGLCWSVSVSLSLCFSFCVCACVFFCLCHRRWRRESSILIHSCEVERRNFSGRSWSAWDHKDSQTNKK